MIIDIIRKAKIVLIEKNVPEPYFIRLSPIAHDIFVSEMKETGGLRYKSRDTKIFEIDGMRVEIDPFCPGRGAYIIGEEK